jgi:hypothetical protein
MSSDQRAETVGRTDTGDEVVATVVVDVARAHADFDSVWSTVR